MEEKISKKTVKKDFNNDSFFCFVRGFEKKETESGNLIVKGYINTTHIDSGFYDEDRGVYIRDRSTKETLERWANEINNGNPRANKVTVNHKQEVQPVGVAKKGTAEVHDLGEGNYGLWVETLVDKTKDNFQDIHYRVENDLLDSFSIEFRTKNPLTGEYMDSAVQEEIQSDGSIIRTLLPGTELLGYTLASRPMNEHSVMIKEILKNRKENKNSNIQNDNEEEIFMKQESEVKENAPDVKEEKETVLSEQVKEVPQTQEKEQKEISDVEYKEFIKYKEQKKKEVKEMEIKEMAKDVLDEVKENLKELKVESKVMHQDKDVLETKEFSEYKEIISIKPELKKDGSIELKMSGIDMMKKAARYAESKGLIGQFSVGWVKPTSSIAESREFKNFRTNGRFLEFKGLGITTNQQTDSDYLLSAPELQDVFDPIVYNVLNQTTVTWGILAKDDFSMKGNNLVQFRLKTGTNSTAGAYTGNAINTGNVTRTLYATKFKKYQVGIEVDGDMIAAARGGPIGDVFAQEVLDSTEDLLQVLNQALFAEVGLETASGVIGFEYITDSAGNTSLYNVTRSAANYLSPDSAGDTYINGSSANLSITNLRSAKRQAIKEGANMQNLVFIGDHIQGDKLRGIYDSAQRLVPTSSRFGFEGMMTFDGIPFFEDKDCNDDDVFLVDLETHRVAIWVPPTLEMLGKDSDSQKGFVKTYLCTYNRAPRRMVQIYANATS